jgi:hypothetical protein
LRALDRIKNIQDKVQEVEPKISYNEENIKHYLDEAMEIGKIRGLQSLPWALMRGCHGR